jgi:predicted nucleic acid-binding protein
VATYFADTSLWIGLSSKRDQHHHRAIVWHEWVIRTSSTILTTEAVLLEWEWLNACLI